jgi:hypothetical protein
MIMCGSMIHFDVARASPTRLTLSAGVMATVLLSSKAREVGDLPMVRTSPHSSCSFTGDRAEPGEFPILSLAFTAAQDRDGCAHVTSLARTADAQPDGDSK